MLVPCRHVSTMPTFFANLPNFTSLHLLSMLIVHIPHESICSNIFTSCFAYQIKIIIAILNTLYNMNVLTIYIHRQCGVKDPSWGEIKHFVCFLDTQLRSCEKSVFCNEDIVGDVMTGLKTFAVKFMIRMSKVRTSFVIKCRSCLL